MLVVHLPAQRERRECKTLNALISPRAVVLERVTGNIMQEHQVENQAARDKRRA